MPDIVLLLLNILAATSAAVSVGAQSADEEIAQAPIKAGAIKYDFRS